MPQMLLMLLRMEPNTAVDVQNRPNAAKMVTNVRSADSESMT